jgi:hypothetical protein
MQISNRPGIADLDPAELLAVQGGDTDMKGEPIPPEEQPLDPVYWQLVAGIWKMMTTPPIVVQPV